MKLFIICKVMVALSYEGTQIVEMELYGKVLKETKTHITADYSEDIKRLPLIGSPKNYSRVVSLRNKCWGKHYEEEMN